MRFHTRLWRALLLCLLWHGIAQVRAETTEAQSTEENHEAGVSVLATFVVMLIIGVASYHVLAFTKIPYTAVLIVRPTILNPYTLSLQIAAQTTCCILICMHARLRLSA